MEPFYAAALQLNSQPDLLISMQNAERAVEKAAEKESRFIALPENFAFLGNEMEQHRQAETISDTIMADLPKWAMTYNATILAGGFPVRTASGKIYNRAVVFNNKGKEIARYDKIHLFEISLSKDESYRESKFVEPGVPEAVVCKTEMGVRIGLSICYDVRFPELYRKLAEKKADVMCVPSAFTRPTGEAHWEVLLRARAIENTSYIIAPAQTGTHGRKRKTYGHSMIIDPWGRILSDAGSEPGMALAEINPDHITDIRKVLPSLQHRKAVL